MPRLYVILAIFPHDADTVAVSTDKTEALNTWRAYMRNGETRLDDKNELWITTNAVNLLQYGISERQDSGVFYRMNPMIAT